MTFLRNYTLVFDRMCQFGDLQFQQTNIDDCNVPIKLVSSSIILKIVALVFIFTWLKAYSQ